MSREPLTQESPTSSDWDRYWTASRKSEVVYTAIADVYRKLIIRQSLKRTFARHIPIGCLCLHAGAGSGDVDLGVSDRWEVIGLDFSWEATQRYRAIHDGQSPVIHADNFNLPFTDNQFECIFNLGVMEHFNVNQIEEMLIEFQRVLKPEGKIILFWPPRYGLSVVLLKVFHSLVHSLKSDFIPLHPQEISLIRSRKSIRKVIQKAGFQSITFSFQLRDLYTHEIIVASVGSKRI